MLQWFPPAPGGLGVRGRQRPSLPRPARRPVLDGGLRPEPPAANCDSSAPPCAHRLGWAALLARVVAAELSGCPACGGRLRIVAARTDPASIRTYLEGG